MNRLMCQNVIKPQTAVPMNEQIKDFILNYKTQEAFWALADGVMNDSEKQKYLLRFLSFKNNVALLIEDVEKIKTLADEGNPYMQYAYARYHEILMPEPESKDIIIDYCTEAIAGGVADAHMCIALGWRDGDFGEVDHTRYIDEYRKALEEGSRRAFYHHVSLLIYGEYDNKADPHKAYDEAECLLNLDTEMPDAMLYRLMGTASEKLGRKADAINCFELAVKWGDMHSIYEEATCAYVDDEGCVIDRQEFIQKLDEGREFGLTESYLLDLFLLDDDTYNALSEQGKATLPDALKDELQLAWLQGDNLAPYFLGQYHENGNYGFTQDHEEAFMWYSRGAILRSPLCYDALAKMILDNHSAPDGYDEAYGYECAYKALNLDNKDPDYIKNVYRGYQKGFLTHHAAMIESFYLPQYEKLTGELLADYDDFDVHEDDNHEYRCDGEQEQEMEEDMQRDKVVGGINPDFAWQTCTECVEEAEERWRNQKNCWEIAELVRTYLKAAKDLLSIQQMINELYATNKRMLDVLHDHPRLKLQLMRCQMDTLYEIELQQGHELSITEDLLNEIRTQEKNIRLADEGRLDEIPQTGHLKRDPVEWTARYEEVIDEAEREAHEQLKDVPRGMGFCFAYWPEKREALARRGVEWRDPHLMNPHVIFH